MTAPMNPSVRRKALRTFRQRGVVVHVGALEHLFSTYESLPDVEFSDFLDSVFDLLGRSDGAKDGMLTREVAESIASRLQRDCDRKEGVATASAEVIDIFKVPTWEPADVSSNAFSASHRIRAPSKPVIDALAPEKANMFRMRYELIKGKTLRNEKFTPPASGLLSSKKNIFFRLTGIESLSNSKGDQLVLGMLTQLEEGSWYLEDLNGNVRVDLSEASVTPGFHTEGSFVIAHGRLIEPDGADPYFRVSAMGTPPLERREQSLTALSNNQNLFGGSQESSDQATLLKMEKEAVDSVFLFLSDVALDNSKVIAGLRYIFKGYLEDEVLPKIIVLMGNFLSHPFGQDVNDMMTLTEKFTELGNMIRKDFEELADQSMFVIIPGTNDPGPGNVLPRPPLPKIFVKGFVNAIGAERVQLGTNPCRLRYLTQELVFVRDDLMLKMVRHCAVKPEYHTAGSMSEHLIKTIADQMNLCPLPNSSRPILWHHAQAMWLFPLPHAIIMADKVDGYICKYGGSLGLNPGSFGTDFSFQMYLPGERRAQQCSLDSETIAAPEESKPLEESNVAVQSGNGDDEHETTPAVSDMEIGETEQGTDESIQPHPVQAVDSKNPNSQSLDGREEELPPEDQDGRTQENLIVVDGKQITTQEDSHSESEAESDDSLLVPVEGIEKRDIKALLRQSAAYDDSGCSATRR